MCKVVHCKKEAFDVYIGRPSKWGNPFSHLKDATSIWTVKTRSEAVAAYENYLITQIETGKITKEEVLELDGKTLGCWCKPKECHGDAIIRVVEWIKSQSETATFI